MGFLSYMLFGISLFCVTAIIYKLVHSIVQAIRKKKQKRKLSADIEAQKQRPKSKVAYFDEIMQETFK